MAQPPSLAQLSAAPVFNTKAVALETSVPPDTFRAWERRYGVPRPQRTQGGHRLYSERDIAVIRWLRDRTAEGMNISHAVMLLSNVLEDDGALPVTNSSRGLDQFVGELTQCLISFDASTADRLLGEAFAIHPFEHVLLELIQPVMSEVGERWHRARSTWPPSILPLNSSGANCRASSIFSNLWPRVRRWSSAVPLTNSTMWGSCWPACFWCAVAGRSSTSGRAYR